MSPDPDDPLYKSIQTLDDAKHLLLGYIMGVHMPLDKPLRFSHLCHGANPRRAHAILVPTVHSPMDTALRTIRREVLCHHITVHWNSYEGYIVLFRQTSDGQWMPLPAEAFPDHKLREFCTRVLELCSAWEGQDQHLNTG